MELERREVPRELGTDARDVPHEFIGFDECRVCGRGVREVRHVEWARVEAASRQTAAAGGLPRVQG